MILVILALLTGVAIWLVRLSRRAPDAVIARRGVISTGLLVVDALALFGTAAALFASPTSSDGADSLIASGFMFTALIVLSIALTTMLLAVSALLLVIKRSSSLLRQQMLVLVVTSVLFAYAVIPATLAALMTERIWIIVCVGIVALGALAMTWVAARGTLAAHGASRSELKAVGFIVAMTAGAFVLFVGEIAIGVASYSLLLV